MYNLLKVSAKKWAKTFLRGYSRFSWFRFGGRPPEHLLLRKLSEKFRDVSYFNVIISTRIEIFSWSLKHKLPLLEGLRIYYLISWNIVENCVEFHTSLIITKLSKAIWYGSQMVSESQGRNQKSNRCFFCTLYGVPPPPQLLCLCHICLYLGL